MCASILAIWLSLLCVDGTQAASATDSTVQSTVKSTIVWRGGAEGYHTYRIPALLVAKSGAILAFCEGRKNSARDSGNIDLLLKRSTDGGATWSPQQVIWSDGENTCGNPCPVIDQNSGVIWLLMTHNLGADTGKEIGKGTSQGTRTVWVASSADDGATWSTPKEITATTKHPDWSWLATGPGVGIQLSGGPHKGRLVIPCDCANSKTRVRSSYAIYSDDAGQTWRRGETVPKGGTDECQVAELTDGRLLLNMRNERGKGHHRAISYSSDAGQTWTEPRRDPALPEPVCQGSLLSVSPPDQPDARWLLFSNPASESRREKLTLRLSQDDGATWPRTLILEEGPAAYSCLAALSARNIGCLYERGPYREIALAIIPLSAVAESTAP